MNLQDIILEDVQAALAEDLGLPRAAPPDAARDLTAQLVSANQTGLARVITREAAVVCGAPWFDACFKLVDPDCRIHWDLPEGALAAPGQQLCEIRGLARALLTAERPALNFLQTLSAVATQTRRHADIIAGTRARILDTRKTLPGLRRAQKYAVQIGGGDNQRMDLSAGVLIKENHITAAGSIAAVLERARQLTPAGVPIQIEVEDMAQLESALAAGATLILLDNFSLDALRQAVALTAGRAELEASGGITPDTLRAIAETGVDRISAGTLTKDIRAIDLSMRFA